MTDLERAKFWLSRIGYKPGWTFDVRAVDGELRLSAVMSVTDARDADRQTTVTGEIELDPRTLEELDGFQAAVHQLITHMEMHEVGEWLTVDGTRPFDPHLS